MLAGRLVIRTDWRTGYIKQRTGYQSVSDRGLNIRLYFTEDWILGQIGGLEIGADRWIDWISRQICGWTGYQGRFVDGLDIKAVF